MHRSSVLKGHFATLVHDLPFFYTETENSFSRVFDLKNPPLLIAICRLTNEAKKA